MGRGSSPLGAAARGWRLLWPCCATSEVEARSAAAATATAATAAGMRPRLERTHHRHLHLCNAHLERLFRLRHSLLHAIEPCLQR